MTQSEDKPLTFGEFKVHLSQALTDFYRTLLEPRFISLDTHLRGLRSEFYELQSEFYEFKNESLSRFDHLYKVTEDLRQENLVTHYQLKRIDQRLDRVEQRLDALEIRH